MCTGCRRHEVECVYDNPFVISTPVAFQKEGRERDDDDSGQRSTSGTPSLLNVKISNDWESRDRRLLELRLLHHFTTKTYRTLLGDTTSNVNDLFSLNVPQLAFTNDGLLYSMLALSALHMATEKSDDVEAMDAHRTYLDLALQTHAADIHDINRINADAACVAATMLRCTAFGLLRHRSREPYEPPTQWLQMTNSALELFISAWQFLELDSDSIAVRLVMRPPYMRPDNEDLFRASHRQNLQHLLQQPDGEMTVETRDEDTQEAYHATLSYIGGIHVAILKSRENPSDIW